MSDAGEAAGAGEEQEPPPGRAGDTDPQQHAIITTIQAQNRPPQLSGLIVERQDRFEQRLFSLQEDLYAQSREQAARLAEMRVMLGVMLSLAALALLGMIGLVALLSYVIGTGR